VVLKKFVGISNLALNLCHPPTQAFEENLASLFITMIKAMETQVGVGMMVEL